MSASTCPDIEQLFTWLEEGDPQGEAHLRDCAACAELFESHRQLEKDLLRLTDPLPPPDFVHKVMAKVEAHPVPVRREVWTGLSILGGAIAAVAVILLGDAATAGAFGTTVASLVIGLKNFAVMAMHALGAVWATAAVPLAAIASAMLMIVLLGVRRLANPKEARVLA